MSELADALSEHHKEEQESAASLKGNKETRRQGEEPAPLHPHTRKQSDALLYHHLQNSAAEEQKNQERPAPLKDTSWQDILWREWRNTSDEEYAEHLFNLIGDEPVPYWAILIDIALAIFYGGLVGLLIALWVTLSNSMVWGQAWWLFTGIGASVGILSRLLKPRLSWRNWLFWLTQDVAPNEFGLWVVILVLALLGSVGWMMGWSTGLEQTVGFMASGIVIALTLGLKLVSWLVNSGRKPNPKQPHRYRTLWFWWRQRPQGIEVETALRQACEHFPESEEIWAEALQNLKRRKKEPDTIRELIIHLQSLDWVERFTARQLLVAYGGEAVDELQALANKITSPLRKTAARLLQGIEQETTARLAHRADQLLCPHCLALCGVHSVSALADSTITFYGCRVCRQSREFWEGEVVAVLDAGMSAEPIRQNGMTRINWLSRRELFDFHWVEIVQASDEEVERFAVQVGNDTDPFRQMYKQIRCLVAPECDLSENTLRILASVFGEVVRE